jgi:hypothetical protein
VLQIHCHVVLSNVKGLCRVFLQSNRPRPKQTNNRFKLGLSQLLNCEPGADFESSLR